MDLQLLDGWIPIRIYWQQSQAMVDWCYLGTRRFSEPFFEQTIQQLLWQPFNELFRHQTPIETLAELQKARPGLAPAGFIFHMSRCGSTLVARLLAALPETDLTCEAEPLDSMVHLVRGAQAPDEWRERALRTMVGALGRRPSRHWFVKLNAWHALALPLFRRAFPDVPWLFLHRDPAAILVSQMVERGTELTPEIVPSTLFGIAEGTALPGEVYCARALATLAEAALAAQGGLFVDHAALPGALPAIFTHFGIDPTEAEATPVRELARRNAKRPAVAYRPGEAAIPPAVRDAAETWLVPLHARLKAVHGEQSLL